MFTSVFCGGKGKGKMGKREDFEWIFFASLET